MTISIIIPNFNGKELLEKNLPFLIKAKENKKNNIKEIIVVDDASTDDSVIYLKNNFSKSIKLIIHNKNKGFSASVNTGVKNSSSNLVCLINSDVVVNKNFLEKMQEDFGDEKVFAVSLHEKGYGPSKGEFVDGFIVHDGQKESKNIEETFWANGGSAVFRRSIWIDLKGMDEKVLSPFYWEDLDLSYRAQKRGYKILWEPNSIVIHEHESTMKKLNQKYLQRIRERNQLLFVWKNLTSKSLMRKHVGFLVKRIVNYPGYFRIFIMAISKMKVVKEARKVEIKETIVSDEAIFAKFN
ncbi:glycosyltransferase family 2 protein [soil metagenome]